MTSPKDKAPISVPTKAVDKPLSAQTRKRFYKTVTLAGDDAGHGPLLDGRGVRTPGKRPLKVPSRALGEAMVAEWEAQGETIEPTSMPLTQLANTALDRVAEARAALTDELIRYAGSDLLCYRATEPDSLVARQAAAWDPILDWLSVRHGARLTVTGGLMPVEQPAEALTAVRVALDGMDDWRFTVVQGATALCGSIVLALALADGRLTAPEALALATLDEAHQMELWGEDKEALARRANIGEELASTARFLSMLG